MKTSALPRLLTADSTKAFCLAAALYAAAGAALFGALHLRPEITKVEAGAPLQLALSKFSTAPAAAPAPAPEAPDAPTAPPAEKAAPEPEPALRQTEPPAPPAASTPAPSEIKPAPHPKAEVPRPKRQPPQQRAQPKRHAQAAEHRRPPRHDPALKPARENPQPNAASSSQAPAAAAPSGGAPAADKPRLIIYGRDNLPELYAIKRAIDRAQVYPRRARMLHHQGRAVAEFTLKKGRLTGLKLTESTGFPELDEAALEAIVRAQADFPQVEARIRIPIVYRLTR